ncbi:hypothetical protein [Paraburkholderia madseniana]|uniref:hypothetical protein n=1 Tax=Paraburkholderia madseniana TaxID=2599607 RepID=UPI0018EE2D11|nr:hypothetical protein [Paraburkholderia madseniana]
MPATADQHKQWGQHFRCQRLTDRPKPCREPWVLWPANKGAQPNHDRTPRDPSTPRDPASLVVGAITAQVVGGLVTQMSPFMIAGLIDGLSLSERDAGFVVSVELLILAVTAIAIAPALSRFAEELAARLRRDRMAVCWRGAAV